MLQALLKVQDSASGESVSESNEAKDLIRELNQLGVDNDLYRSWQQIGSSGAVFSSIIVSGIPTFQSSPLNSLYIDMQFPITIPTATPTSIDLSTATEILNFGKAFNVLPTGEVYLNPNNLLFEITGYLSWDSNSTGERSIGFTAAVDTLYIVTQKGITVSAPAAYDSFSFNLPVLNRFAGVPSTYCYVYQNSGGDLVLRSLCLLFKVV